MRSIKNLELRTVKEEMEENDNITYYTILEVNPSSSMKTIKENYYKLAKRYHPDRNSNETKFALINEAYSVLKDPHKRVLYNLYGKSAVEVADYISLPISQNTLPASNRRILFFIFIIAFLIENIFSIPSFQLCALVFNVYVMKQIHWRLLTVIGIMVFIYSIIQYFFVFDTSSVDHLVVYCEMVLIVNSGKSISWDTCIVAVACLSFYSFINPIQTPIAVGAFNIGIGTIVTVSSFIRICSSDESKSTFFKFMMRFMVAVPDLQYGMIVLFVFWFFSGLIDSLTGWSIEYFVLGLQLLPINKKPISFVILAVTIINSIVIYMFFSSKVIAILSMGVAHFLITCVCIKNAGPAIKNALSHKGSKEIKFSKRNTTDTKLSIECNEIGRTQISLEEICKDVSLRQPIEWETEKNNTRTEALFLMSGFTYSMELLFCGISYNIPFIRSVTLGCGLSIALFGFGEMMEIHAL